MKELKKFLVVDEAVTSRLEEVGSYSVLTADYKDVFLTINKPLYGNVLFDRAIREIEQSFCETLGEKIEDDFEIKYFLGNTNCKFREHGTDALLDMMDDDENFDLTDSYKYDFQEKDVDAFLMDNTDYCMRFVDGKKMIVKI